MTDVAAELRARAEATRELRNKAIADKDRDGILTHGATLSAYVEAASLVESSQEARAADSDAPDPADSTARVEWTAKVSMATWLRGMAAQGEAIGYYGMEQIEVDRLRQIAAALEPASTEPACTGNCEPGLHDPDCPIHGHAPESKDKRLAPMIEQGREDAALRTSEDAG